MGLAAKVWRGSFLIFNFQLPLNGFSCSLEVEAVVLVVVHEAGGDLDGLGFGEVAIVDFGLKGVGEPVTGLDGVGGCAGGPAGVAAKDEEFV